MSQDDLVDKSSRDGLRLLISKRHDFGIFGQVVGEDKYILTSLGGGGEWTHHFHSRSFERARHLGELPQRGPFTMLWRLSF